MKNIKKEFKEATPHELWVDGVLYNFIYGMLGALVVVAITVGIDLPVLIAYLVYYFFLGRIVNRPKYVTMLGKFIVFPVPTAIGAFTGYKLGPILIDFFIDKVA